MRTFLIIIFLVLYIWLSVWAYTDDKPYIIENDQCDVEYSAMDKSYRWYAHMYIDSLGNKQCRNVGYII